MKPSYIPQYGHACCPHCKSAFNLVDAIPTVVEKLPYNDKMIYMMCPVCHASYQDADKALRKSMENQCFANSKRTDLAIDGYIYPFAVTSMLTMELNDFDPVAAIENGHGLTSEVYFGICAGTHEYCVLSDGIFLVAAKLSSSETA